VLNLGGAASRAVPLGSLWSNADEVGASFVFKRLDFRLLVGR